MIDVIKKSFHIPEVRKKILITFAVLALYRFLIHVPVPNVDLNAIKTIFDQSQFFNVVNLFSGGGLSQVSIISLGVGPYITASIIMQLVTMVIPQLEELSKEGQYGREKINQYTQFLTLPLAIIQSYGLYFIFSKQSVGNLSIMGNMTSLDIIMMVIIMTGGAFLLMWIASLITDYGVGNGVSIIIFAGILARIPSSMGKISIVGADATQMFNLLIFIGIALVVIAGVVYVNEAYRKIDIQYSTRVTGSKTLGGGSSYIPVKINQAGVIPIIFAVSIVLLPSFFAGYLQQVNSEQLQNIGLWISMNFTPGKPFYTALYFFLVFIFTYFYTAVTFNPEKIADDVRRSGGFIPGVRPGKATENYLSYIITRLTFAGGIFLGAIAVLPLIVQNFTGITSLAIGGTGLLIVVSVVLETVKQIEAQVITREYETFTR